MPTSVQPKFSATSIRLPSAQPTADAQALSQAFEHNLPRIVDGTLAPDIFVTTVHAQLPGALHTGSPTDDIRAYLGRDRASEPSDSEQALRDTVNITQSNQDVLVTFDEEKIPLPVYLNMLYFCMEQSRDIFGSTFFQGITAVDQEAKSRYERLVNTATNMWRIIRNVEVTERPIESPPVPDDLVRIVGEPEPLTLQEKIDAGIVDRDPDAPED